MNRILALVNAIAPAVENLACHQEQCDMDGVMVKVSRQALDEVLEAVNQTVIIAASDGWEPIETAPKDRPIQAHDLYLGALTAIWFPAKGAERWTIVAYGNEAARERALAAETELQSLEAIISPAMVAEQQPEAKS